MHKLLALPLAVLLLAGCADPEPEPGVQGSLQGASSATLTQAPEPEPVVYSDTLHLLAPPTMALVLPEGSTEVATPTGGFGGGPGGGGENGGGAEWAYTVGQYSNVTAAEVHLWIEITETLFPQPLQNPFQPCTWILVLELGSDGDPTFDCLAEPPGPINPGIRELVFTLTALDAEMEENETITLRFSRNAFGPSTNPSVYVLSGSAEHDSFAMLRGLQEIVPET